MKLKTKIQIIAITTMIASVALINTGIYFVFNNISEKIEMDHLTDQANMVTQTMNNNREIPYDDLMRSFLPHNGMIRLISEDGEVKETITRDQQYRDLPVQYYDTEHATWVSGENKGRYGVVYKPYIENDGTVITIEMSNHFIELEETMRTLFYVLLGAAIIMLIPTIIAANVLSRTILKPIQQLIDTMRRNEEDATWQKINLKNRSKDELYEMGITFNRMIDRLQESFEKQEMFVSDASHELKTPIAIIKSYAQLMKRRAADPALTKESIEAIDSEADRMENLVKQMLILARSEEEVPYEEFYMDELCERTMRRFHGMTRKTLQFTPVHKNVLTYGAKDKLEQVIYILIDNAIKYGGEAIDLYVQYDGDNIKVTIHDDGKGIPKEAQEHIFDRFYRIDEARARKDGGTGLGLAIAKAIVQQHQGSLTVLSDDKIGTTFTLVLPGK